MPNDLNAKAYFAIVSSSEAFFGRKLTLILLRISKSIHPKIAINVLDERIVEVVTAEKALESRMCEINIWENSGFDAQDVIRFLLKLGLWILNTVQQFIRLNIIISANTATPKEGKRK